MAVAFLGQRAPVQYQPQSANSVGNGTLNFAGTIRKIYDNQAFLATQDYPACNFLTNVYHNRAPAENGTYPWNASLTALTETEPLTVVVHVPPYCRDIEFWFWAAQSYDDDKSAVPGHIVVQHPSTGAVRKTSLIAGGEDWSGRTTTYNYSSQAAWVALRGSNDGSIDANAEGSTALRVRAELEPTWLITTVRVWLSDPDNLRIYTGYYRAVPFSGKLPMPRTAVTHYYTIQNSTAQTADAFTSASGEDVWISFWFRVRSIAASAIVYVARAVDAGGTMLHGHSYLSYTEGTPDTLTLGDGNEEVVFVALNTWYHVFVQQNQEANGWVDGVSYTGDDWGDWVDGHFKFGESGETFELDIANFGVWDSSEFAWNSDIPAALTAAGIRHDYAMGYGAWPGRTPDILYVEADVSGDVPNSGSDSVFGALEGVTSSTAF